MTAPFSPRATLTALVAALALATPSQAAAAPPNDHLVDAAVVPGLSDVKAAYTTVGATREAGEAQHYESLAGHTVWLKWKPNATGGTYVRSCGANAAPYSAVDLYTGPANATHAQLQELQPDGPFKFPTCQPASHKFTAVAGTTYFFAVDHAAGTAAAPGELEIDQDPSKPVTTFVAPPATTGPQVTLAWAADADSKAPQWQCRLDSGPLQNCGTSGTTKLTGLSHGPHQFHVRAIDWYGNTEASFKSISFTTDAQAPDTVLQSAPPAPGATSATFAFHSPEPGAGFVCTQDGSKPFPCSSPSTWKPTIWNVKHTFTAAAVDQVGNVDPTPVVVTWTRYGTQSPPPPIAPEQPEVPHAAIPEVAEPPAIGPPGVRCAEVVPATAPRRALLSGGWQVHAGGCRTTFTLRLGRRLLTRATAPAGRSVRLRVRGAAARALRRAPRLGRLTLAVAGTDAHGVVHHGVRRPRLG